MTRALVKAEGTDQHVFLRERREYRLRGRPVVITEIVTDEHGRLLVYFDDGALVRFEEAGSFAAGTLPPVWPPPPSIFDPDSWPWWAQSFFAMILAAFAWGIMLVAFSL